MNTESAGRNHTFLDRFVQLLHQLFLRKRLRNWSKVLEWDDNLLLVLL